MPTNNNIVSLDQDLNARNVCKYIKPILPYYSAELAEQKSRALQVLYSFKEFTQASDEIKKKAYKCLKLPTDPMPIYTVVCSANGKNWCSIDLFPGKHYIVGRSKKSDIVLNDPKVSGLHCILKIDDLGRLFIMDAASQNGTYLDGLPIQPQKSTSFSLSSTISTGSTEWKFSRSWKRLNDEIQDNFSLIFKVKSEKSSAFQRHKCRVKDTKNEQSFDIYISLPDAHELLLKYFGLPPMLTACVSLPDQLLSEWKTIYIESLFDRINMVFKDLFQLEYLKEEYQILDNLIQCDLVIDNILQQYIITILIDPVTFSDYSDFYNNHILTLSKPVFPDGLESLAITFRCTSRCIVFNLSQFKKLKKGDVLLPGWNVRKTFIENRSSSFIYLSVTGKEKCRQVMECDCCFIEDKVLLRTNELSINNKENKMNQSDKEVISLCETRFLDLSSEPIVSMKIEIGRLELTLEQVSHLKPGILLSVERKIGDPVDILVGDRVVGTGRLIQIHDEYGVEIVSWKELKQ